MIFAEVVNVVIDNYTLFVLADIGFWAGLICSELKDIKDALKKR